MYRKQMAFQNIICYFALFVGGIVFIYSLGIMTDLYDCLYSTMFDPNNPFDTDVPGSIVYYTMQSFNRSFLISAIIYIVLAVFLFITQTSVRRRYYIGNYIMTAVFVIFSLYLVVWSHNEIEFYRAQWLLVDFDALREHAELFNQKYTESTFWFDIHYAVALLCLAEAALLTWNAVWKTKLMKEEKRLIEEGEKA